MQPLVWGTSYPKTPAIRLALTAYQVLSDRKMLMENMPDPRWQLDHFLLMYALYIVRVMAHCCLLGIHAML